MTYTYRTIRIERGSWDRVAKSLPDAYGLWRGEIGWHTDEGAIMSAEELPERIDGVIDARDEALEPTVRPLDATPPTEDGIYAHRWFDVSSADWPEFLDLSEKAWPDFESTFGVRIVGLWRSLETPDGQERALLITRYPSLAVWESSRPYAPEPRRSEAEAQSVPGAEESRKRFLRRAQLTERTIVRVTRLIQPGPVHP